MKIAPVSFTLETAFGSVPPINRPEDFKELARQAKEEHASEVVREMRDQHIGTLLSYDRDFDRISTIIRQEP